MLREAASGQHSAGPRALAAGLLGATVGLVGAGRVQPVFAGRIAKAWSASCGTPDAPTPPGLTFVLAVARGTGRHPDPIVLPLAIPSRHAGCGASGVIAIHTAPPQPGCITVPSAALSALACAPLGSLLRIYA